MAYTVFVRDWYLADGSPGPGPKHTIHKNVATEEEARRLAKAYNATHDLGPHSRKAEFEGMPSPRKLSVLERSRLKDAKKKLGSLNRELSKLDQKERDIERKMNAKISEHMRQLENAEKEKTRAINQIGIEKQHLTNDRDHAEETIQFLEHKAKGGRLGPISGDVVTEDEYQDEMRRAYPNR